MFYLLFILTVVAMQFWDNKEERRKGYYYFFLKFKNTDNNNNSHFNTPVDFLSNLIFFFLARIPALHDPDMLKTFLANQDNEPEVHLPVRSNPFSVKAKLGKSIINLLYDNAILYIYK